MRYQQGVLSSSIILQVIIVQLANGVSEGSSLSMPHRGEASAHVTLYLLVSSPKLSLEVRSTWQNRGARPLM
eukprot:6282877-Amphidinium_carterae.1